MLTPLVHPPGPDHRHVLCWRFPQAPLALASASVGGGLTRPSWIVNIGVPHDYARVDLEGHAEAVAAELALIGPGIAFFTAHDVRRRESIEHAGVTVTATVGVTRPTWPADPADAPDPAEAPGPSRPGTINIVAALPVRLDPAALIQAALTVTEAKSQALLEAGVPGTGTASDALAVLAAPDGPAERFAGVRSAWGYRLAVATHAAITAGLTSHLPGDAVGAAP